MNTLTSIHIVDKSLLNPTNPVTVNLIGAGGTGSNMVMALAKMNDALIALGHPGLSVTLYDDDIVNEANLGRQLFAQSELGLYKSVALINRVNAFFRTNWKAATKKFGRIGAISQATIFITCVDTVASRMEVAEILNEFSKINHYERNRPLYWMDFGNSRDTGQEILSTVNAIKQPASEKYRTIAVLPKVTDEFGGLLSHSENTDNTPSCSLAEALEKQDLFINPTLANLGASLLFSVFREGLLFNRGFFLNLKDFRAQPIKIA